MKYPLIVIAVWVAYGLINIGFAEWNDTIRRRRIANKDYRQINHQLWAAFYAAVCFPVYLFFKDWWLYASILMLHGCVFAIAYNIFSGNPTFNLSKTSSSLFDQLQVKAGLKSSELVNISALLISITFLIISLLK